MACTNGYDSYIHFFSGFMLVLSITGCLFIQFKLIRVTFKNRTEKICLLYAPVALYLCSFIVYQCTESSAEEMDEAVIDSKWNYSIEEDTIDDTTGIYDTTAIFDTMGIYEEPVMEKKKKRFVKSSCPEKREKNTGPNHYRPTE